MYISTCRTSGAAWYRWWFVSLSCTCQRAIQRCCVIQMAGRVTFVYISTCRPSGSVWYRWRVMSLSCTFHRVVIAALFDTDGGSCNFFVYISMCHTSGCARYREWVLSLSLYGTSGSFLCMRLFMLVSLNPRYLFTDLCQTRVGRRYEKTNVRW